MSGKIIFFQQKILSVLLYPALSAYWNAKTQSQVVETVTLSAENNGTYSWTVVDDGAVWQGVEVEVPEGYKVALEQRRTSFL